jgi:hypothetical protein
MRVRRALLVALFALGALLVTSPAASVASGGTPARVTLKSPGAAPRSPLRLTLASDTSTAATIEFSQSIDQSLDGMPTNSIDVPPIRFVVHTSVGAVAANGDAPIDYSYSDVSGVDDGSISDAQRTQLEAALAPITSLTGSGTMTARSQIVDSEVSGTEALDPSAAQLTGQFSDQLGSLTVPLPIEAVGVGAKWRGVSALNVNGIEARQTYDYVLRSREGSVIVIDVTFTQTAPRQRVKLPGVPSGAKLELTRYRISGRGSMTVDLTQPLPLMGTTRGSGTQTFNVRAEGESGTLKQKLVLDVAISSLSE